MAETETWQVSDTAAVIYEEKLVPAIFGTWALVVAEAVAIRQGDTVLDVACGTGVLAREIASRIGPGGSVTGLDMNDGMLSVARRISPEIDWKKGDAQALPFDDESFDVVVSQFALMYFPDPAKALGEMWRVLHAGGRLAVASWASLDRAEAYAILARIAAERTNEEAAAVLRAPFVLGDTDRLLDLYCDAGIPQPRVETCQRHARFASVDKLVETEVRGSPVDNLLSSAEFEAFLSDARNELARQRLLITTAAGFRGTASPQPRAPAFGCSPFGMITFGCPPFARRWRQADGVSTWRFALLKFLGSAATAGLAESP